ncbi:MAG: hypothetical protein KF816_16390 [Melioribacteraceae bacterium]|nr:hypothetical protein [Melioribacteraceae bacterium]
MNFSFVRNEKVTLLIRIILSAVFILSAYSKLIVPGLIEIILIDQGIAATREVAGYYTRLLVGLELCIGILFLLPYYVKKITIPLTVTVTILFSIYLIYTGFVLGETQNCGCFGEMFKMSPLESLIKNIIILVLVFILYFIIKEKERGIFINATVLIFSLVAVFAVSPLKEKSESIFSRFTSFNNGERADLLSGRKLVAVFDPDCEHCQESVEELKRLNEEKVVLPSLYILFLNESGSTPEKFFEKTKISFPFHEITINEFFDLIGNSPPRYYLLEEGKVVETIDDSFYVKLKRITLK